MRCFGLTIPWRSRVPYVCVGGATGGCTGSVTVADGAWDPAATSTGSKDDAVNTGAPAPGSDVPRDDKSAEVDTGAVGAEDPAPVGPAAEGTGSSMTQGDTGGDTGG